jgi:hypothetical protein
MRHSPSSYSAQLSLHVTVPPSSVAIDPADINGQIMANPL